MDITLGDNDKFYYSLQGKAEGTSYSVTYVDEQARDFSQEIEALLAHFEKTWSVYDPHSLVSCINRNEDVALDAHFTFVLERAKQISRHTDGAFDISAEPLFRAWGFSAQEKKIPTDADIIQLKHYIGMDKVHIEDNRLLKTHPQVVLNANAIAKGYSADLVARFLTEAGCLHYLVEIGGEICLKGESMAGEAWRVGVDRPSEKKLIPGTNLQLILQLTDKALATSGNYRQFYIADGKKITHTINPATGYPVQHNLIATTVLANSAITADAYATAFMVAGIDKAMDWIEENEELDALFICEEAGEYKVYYTEKMEEYIVL